LRIVFPHPRAGQSYDYKISVPQKSDCRQGDKSYPQFDVCQRKYEVVMMRLTLGQLFAIITILKIDDYYDGRIKARGANWCVWRNKK